MENLLVINLRLPENLLFKQKNNFKYELNYGDRKENYILFVEYLI